MASVFVSYPRSEQAQVKPVVDGLELAGLDVFWDEHLGPGKWEDQLLAELRACDVFVVFITEEVVKRGQASYVHNEISEAIETETSIIVPVIVGALNFESDLGRLGIYQSIQVDQPQDLIKLNRWAEYVESIKAHLASGASNKSFGVLTAYKDAQAAGWPVSGDDLIERQALALAVVLLEGELPFLVTDAAGSLQQLIEKEVRDETEDEVNARPRSFVSQPQSVQLESIGATRTFVSAGYHASQEVVRFADRNHRVRLLEYLWQEQPRVRTLLLHWVQSLIEGGASEALALQLGRALSHLALIDLPGLRYEVVGRMLTPPMSHNNRMVLSELLAVAYDIKANRPVVRSILKQIEEGDPQLARGRRNAAMVALGALAERTPVPAIDVLKQIESVVRSPSRNGERLRHAILRSPMLYGRKQARADMEGFDDVDDDDDIIEQVVAAKTEPAESDKPAEVPAQEGQETSPPDATEEEDLEPPRVSAGLPSAMFLRALAGWIDEKIAKRPLLIRRQAPLWIFLSAFEQMPLYAESAPQRLTLEELVKEIDARNGAVLDAIERGMVRAALAKPQGRSTYLAPQHLQSVFRLFAQERHESEWRKTDEDDPFLVFARRIYRAVAVQDPGYEDYVLRGSDRFLTPQDVSFITTAPMRRKEAL